MDLTIQTWIFNNAKYHLVIFFKFRGRYFTSLAMLGLEAKASVFSTVKENLILFFGKFSVFVLVVIN